MPEHTMLDEVKEFFQLYEKYGNYKRVAEMTG